MIALLGIVLLLVVAYGLSKNRAAIAWPVILNGLLLQAVLAVVILQVHWVRDGFALLGKAIEVLLGFSRQGAEFVFGSLMEKTGFSFVLTLVPTIIFIAALSSFCYHIGLLQKVVGWLARLVHRLLGLSGAECLSNISSVFVGQVEAQLLVKPYVAGMTQSELLTVMTGSMACIAGGVMAVFIQMGIPAAYLIAASLMAIPGAVVMAKLVYPETQVPQTRAKPGEPLRLSLHQEHPTVNVIDALAVGAIDGLKIGATICALLITFIAIIHLLDYVLGFLGHWLGVPVAQLTLKMLLGWVLAPVAFLLGVPWEQSPTVAALMGTKLMVNEFLAYIDLAPLLKTGQLGAKAGIIASFALCGFANFSSVAMQVGGIGAMAPSRKADLARLGLLAMVCGSLASYLSSAVAGLFYEPAMPWLPWLWLAVLVAAKGLLFRWQLAK